MGGVMSVSGCRRPLLAAMIAFLAAAAASCGSNPYAAYIPTTVDQTATFTGTLSPSGTATQIFYVKSGKVTVTLTSITPDSTASYGFIVGIYNPYYLSCAPVTTNAAAKQGQSLQGLATATTALCVQITDSNNAIPTGTTDAYTITVTSVPNS